MVVENDANAAAWGEYRFGAGRGVADVVLITWAPGSAAGSSSTAGWSAAPSGIAAELGHMRLVPDGRPLRVRQPRLLGAVRLRLGPAAAGAALVEEQPHATAPLLRAGRRGPRGADGGQMISTAAHATATSPPRSCSPRLGRWLGEGIATVAAMLDPAVVVIGGGVSEAGELLLAPARAGLPSRSCPRAAYRPQLEIRQAQLGNDAGIVGAADLARLP